jgi:two-component system cell cycle sensor histidine kinase/response regulator CckA
MSMRPFKIQPVRDGSIVIYAVDDQASLTDLYKCVLSAVGYHVRTFTDRKEALESMRSESNLPNLLVTDCLGGSIPVDQFLDACRDVNPNLRILMASGLHKQWVAVSSDRQIGFIQKPFSPGEFIEAVQTALVA